MKDRATRYNFRKLRVRTKISGSPERPRLSVYRSLKHVHAQIIDDTVGKTLAAASSGEKGFERKSGLESAGLVGERLGQRALEKGVKKVVFDRGARPYHGRIKALADGARKSGLQF